MTTETRTLRYDEAAALFAALPEIGDDMDSRPAPGQGAIAFMQTLVTSPTPEEAITFAAHALARRHAVWWGHECLRHVAEVLDPADTAMLALAARWVGAPEEETRVEVLESALAQKVKSPGVWIALGAGWSGGAMAPRAPLPTPPPPYLTGRAVNAGVLSALARIDQARRARVLEGFVKMAQMLAQPG